MKKFNLKTLIKFKKINLLVKQLLNGMTQKQMKVKIVEFFFK